MTAPNISPSSTGASQIASRFALQVNTGTSVSPTWVTAFGMFNFQPQPDYNTSDNSDFDSGGWGSDLITSRKLTINASFRDKLYGGIQDPGQAALQAAAESTPPALIEVRWFDRNGGAEAKQGSAYIQWQPQGGGVDDESTTNVVIMIQGKPTAIANPMTAGAKPIASGASPSGAAATEMVSITGTYFTGATAVKFGATNATDFVVINDNLIVASMPTGSAGAANITVTTAGGTSDPLSYTRGA